MLILECIDDVVVEPEGVILLCREPAIAERQLGDVIPKRIAGLRVDIAGNRVFGVNIKNY